MEDRLNYIIDFRHGIIHRMEVDHRLTKSQVDDIFAATLAIIDAFVEHIEKRRGTPIRDSARRRHNRLGKTTGKTEGIPNLDHRGMGRGGEGGH